MWALFMAERPTTSSRIMPSLLLSSGSGTVINVANARYFSDGWNIVEGDLVKVGSNDAVRITDISVSDDPVDYLDDFDVTVKFSGNTIRHVAYFYIDDYVFARKNLGPDANHHYTVALVKYAQ